MRGQNENVWVSRMHKKMKSIWFYMNHCFNTTFLCKCSDSATVASVERNKQDFAKHILLANSEQEAHLNIRSPCKSSCIKAKQRCSRLKDHFANCPIRVLHNSTATCKHTVFGGLRLVEAERNEALKFQPTRH